MLGALQPPLGVDAQTETWFHCIDEALAWFDRMKPERGILTNMHVDIDWTRAETETPDNVSAAFDGMQIELPGCWARCWMSSWVSLAVYTTPINAPIRIVPMATANSSSI
mgnify:CR=1 FL=1